MMIALLCIAALVAFSTLGFGITGSSSAQNSTSSTDSSYHPEDNSVQSTGPVSQVTGSTLTTNITNSADATLGEKLLQFADIAFKNNGTNANSAPVAAAMPAMPQSDNTRLMIIGGAALVLAVVAAFVLPKLLSKKA